MAQRPITGGGVASPQTEFSREEQALLAELIGAGSLDDTIPGLARNGQAMQRIEAIVRGLETAHELILGDARAARQ